MCIVGMSAITVDLRHNNRGALRPMTATATQPLAVRPGRAPRTTAPAPTGLIPASVTGLQDTLNRAATAYDRATGHRAIAAACTTDEAKDVHLFAADAWHAAYYALMLLTGIWRMPTPEHLARSARLTARAAERTALAASEHADTFPATVAGQ